MFFDNINLISSMITLDSRTGVANEDLMLLTRVIICIPAFAALAECDKCAHQKIEKGVCFTPFYPVFENLRTTNVFDFINKVENIKVCFFFFGHFFLQ